MAKERPVLGNAVDSEAFALVRLLGFDSLTEALGVYGEEQDQVQYRADLAMGRALVRQGRIATGGLDRLMASLEGFYRRLGLGLVAYATGEDDAIIVSIAECAGCHGAEPAGRPICFVEAGIICWVLSEGVGVEFTAHPGAQLQRRHGRRGLRVRSHGVICVWSRRTVANKWESTPTVLSRLCGVFCAILHLGGDIRWRRAPRVCMNPPMWPQVRRGAPQGGAAG